MAPNQGNRNSKKQNQQQSQQQNQKNPTQKNQKNQPQNQKNQQQNQKNQQQTQTKKGNGAKSKKNNNQNNQKPVPKKDSGELIGREEGVDTPPNLELLEQLLNIYPLRRDLWLACVRSLNGRFSLKRLLSRDQRDFFSWPLMPRRPPGRPERCSRYLAIDCEMIEVKGDSSYPARFSLVNYYGKQLLNVFIEPGSRVVNWRTSKSGMSQEVYEKARRDGKVVQLWEAIDLIDFTLEKHRAVLIGHNILSDLRALMMAHMDPDSFMDTQILRRFHDECGGNGLKRLTEAYFNVKIQCQSNGHDPLEDARASMLLFRTFQHELEAANKAACTFGPKDTPYFIDETTYY